jgi:hypothetical protein
MMAVRLAAAAGRSGVTRTFLGGRMRTAPLRLFRLAPIFVARASGSAPDWGSEAL